MNWIFNTMRLTILEGGTEQKMVAAWNSESGDNIGGALRSTDNGVFWLTRPAGVGVGLA